MLKLLEMIRLLNLKAATIVNSDVRVKAFLNFHKNNCFSARFAKPVTQQRYFPHYDSFSEDEY